MLDYKLFETNCVNLVILLRTSGYDLHADFDT